MRASTLFERGLTLRICRSSHLAAKPFPSPVSSNAREMSHQIVPTADVHARDFEHQLRPIQVALAAFEGALNNYANQDRRERARHDSIAVAVKLLRALWTHSSWLAATSSTRPLYFSA
jgi:hypothetical protein